MKRIAPNVYASTEYPGVNVGFVVVAGGAIAVDAPALPQHARAWRQKMVEVAGGPVLYVVLTDAHPDRLLSASLLEAPIVASKAAYDRAATYTDGFWRGLIESWARRFPKEAGDLVGVLAALPEIMFTERLTLHKGGKTLVVERVAGSAPDSAWVHLRELGVLFSGDTVVVGRHPLLAAAVDTKAWLDTLKELRRPRFAETVIVPGRGPICNPSATISLSDYIALVRRRARSLQMGGRARADRAAVTGELLSVFPVADDEREMIQRRIKAGLDRVCEELKGDG